MKIHAVLMVWQVDSCHPVRYRQGNLGLELDLVG